MQLENYISDLLYHYQCVTIPDLGAFLTKQTSAELQKLSQTVFPPRKIISFNEQLQNNDGILANYIAVAENISYEEAVKKISNSVRHIKSYLIQGETINFIGVGNLKFNFEGRIKYEPSLQTNYLTDSFGLSQVSAKKNTKDLAKSKTPIVVPISTANKQPRGKRYYKYAAILILALSATGLTLISQHYKEIEEQNEIALKNAQTLLEHKIQEATFVLDNPLPPAFVNVKKETNHLHIVAGAFRAKSNAIKKVNQLIAAGFPNARMVGINNYNLFEVVYDSYSSLEIAEINLRKIRRNFNREAWLLIRNP